MSFNSVGDLAQNLIARRQTSSLNNRLASLTAELTTGRKQDIGAAVRGDFSVLASMQRTLALQDAFDDARNQISPRLDAMQSALSGIAEPAADIGFRVLNAVNYEDEAGLDRNLSGIKGELENVIGLLNTRVADRTIFSGVATDQPAVARADDILAALRVEVTGATDATDFLARIDAWFDTGGGFETDGYLGGAVPQTGVPVSSTISVTQQITAATPEIRDAIKQLAVLSLAGEGLALAIDRDEVASQAANGLINSKTGIIELQADIGYDQNRIERATAQTAAERLGLEEARNALTAADPFEAATRLEEVRTQLETLYLVTARTSQLNLASFLR